MKILRLSQSSVIKVYHRTGSEDKAASICQIGFMSGHGAAYGRGIYATTSFDDSSSGFESSLRNNNLRAYGGVLIESEVNVHGFLIFEIGFAKQIYGNDYRISDQVKKVIGLDKLVSNPSEQNLRDLENFDLMSEQHEWSSHVAQPFVSKYNPCNQGVPGIIFKGQTDGNVVVTFKEVAITPIRHAWVDGKTYKNPDWKPCPARTIESLRELQEDEEKEKRFLAERKSLLNNMSTWDTHPTNINLDPNHFPNLPEGILDNLMVEWLYQDDKRIQKLDPETQERFKDVIAIEFMLRKLRNEPLLYWDEYAALDQESKEKIPSQDITDIFQRFVDDNPSEWKGLPDEMKQQVSADAVADHYYQTTRKNESNWKFIPHDIIPVIASKYNINPPQRFTHNVHDDNQNAVSWQGLRPETVTDETYDTHVVTVPSDSMNYVRNEINKLNKRAIKLGLSPVYIQVLDEDRITGYKKVEIVGKTPVLAGWVLVARLTPLQGDDGQFVNDIIPISGEIVPQDYARTEPFCAQCNIKRDRKLMYIVHHQETGEYKLIGSTCLGDFVQDTSKTPQSIAAHAEKLAQLLVAFGQLEDKASSKDVQKKFKKDGVPLPYFLGHVVRLMRTQDYISGTGKEVFRVCLQDTPKDDDPLTVDEISLVTNTIDYALSLDELPVSQYNAYKSTINSIALANRVQQSTSNYAASMIKAYQKSLSEADQVDYTTVLGKLGTRAVFEGEIVVNKPIFFQLKQNDTKAVVHQTYFVGKDEKNRYAIWSLDGMEAEENDIVTIKGTISAYTKHADSDATSLTDVQLISREEFEGLKDQNQEVEVTEDTIQKPEGTPPAYNAGDVVTGYFTIKETKSGKSGGGRAWTLFKMTDDWDGPNIGRSKGVSVFNLYPPPKVGDRVKVKGTVKLTKWGVQLNPVKIIGDQPQQDRPQQQDSSTVLHQIGEKIKLELICLDRTWVEESDLYPGYHKMWWVDPITARQYGSSSSKYQFNKGDKVLVSGSIKNVIEEDLHIIGRPRYKIVQTFEERQKAKGDQGDQNKGQQPPEPPEPPSTPPPEPPKDDDDTDTDDTDILSSSWYSAHKVSAIVKRLIK